VFDGLIAYYKFNADLGTTLYDHSGNGNHGTINGATWSSCTTIAPCGCTNPDACNYDPEAEEDDGSCATFDECGICDGSGIADGACDCSGNVVDCAGQCGGSAVVDECGVCGSDNSTCPIIIDIDGNIYSTIQIGTQNWMQQNLKATHYLNGENINGPLSNQNWLSTNQGAYNNNFTGQSIYGKEYNWFAVNDDRGICPEGWKIPSINDYNQLAEYLGGTNVAGGKLKSTGTLENNDGLWYEPNSGATNESGFTGLPAGLSTGISNYNYISERGFHWASDEGNYMNLDYNNTSMTIQDSVLNTPYLGRFVESSLMYYYNQDSCNSLHLMPNGNLSQKYNYNY
jgi:uncharacterized protein (TIGR02145 family)